MPSRADPAPGGTCPETKSRSRVIAASPASTARFAEAGERGVHAANGVRSPAAARGLGTGFKSNL